MIHHAELRHLLELRTFAAVVGIRIDGNPPTRSKDTGDFDVFRIHQTNEVLHDFVHAIFVEVAVVAEAEQVQLERLALHHAHIGHVGDIDGGEVGLAGDGAQARELGTVELHEVVVARVLVLEGLQYRRVVVGRVLGMLVAEQGDAAGASLILIAASRGSGGSSR